MSFYQSTLTVLLSLMDFLHHLSIIEACKSMAVTVTTHALHKQLCTALTNP